MVQRAAWSRCAGMGAAFKQPLACTMEALEKPDWLLALGDADYVTFRDGRRFLVASRLLPDATDKP